MREFSLRYLYNHLGLALLKLPFKITSHNRVVAIAITLDQYEEYERLKNESKK